MKLAKKLNYSNYFPDHINYLEIAKNKIFFEDKSIAFVLKLDQIYDEMQSNNQIVKDCDELKKLLNSSRSDEKVQFYYKKDDHFQDIIHRHREENQSDSKLVTKVMNGRIEKLNQDIKNNNLHHHRLYLIVKIPYEFEIDHMRTFLFSSGKLEDKVIERLKGIEADVEKREQAYKNHLENIDSLDFSVPRKQEVIDLISSHINQEVKTDVEFRNKKSLVDSDLYKSRDALYINGKYVRVITIKQDHEPPETWATLSKRLTNAKLNFNYELVINYQKLDQEKAKSKLKWSKRKARADSKDVGGDVDHEAQKSQEDIDNLQQDMARNAENLFKVELFIVVKADTLDQLNDYCDTVMGAMKKMGAVGYLESFGNINLFWDTLPGNSINFNNSKDFRFRTSYLVHLLPVYGPMEGTKAPTIILRNRYKGITYFNPVSDKYKSKNKVVAATTGAGKSFFINHEIKSLLYYDPIITIVDKGGSFKKLTEILGGSYFEISPKYSISPFNIGLTGQRKRIYWENLLKVMIKDEQGLSTYSKTIIEKAIQKAMELEIKRPIISDWIEIIKNLEIPDAAKLKEAKNEVWIFLDRWTIGPRGEFLNNKQSNFNAEDDIISIDLQGLKNQPELQEVFMYFINAMIWHRTEKNRHRVTANYFDEVWDIFATEFGQKMMDEGYRTMRKYNGSITSISQKLQDYEGNEHAKGILVNADFKYLLDQGDIDYEILDELLNLKAHEIEQVKTLKTIPGEYSEIFCKYPDGAFIGRLVPNSFEYWIDTTHGPEIEIYEEQLDKFNGDVLKTINYLSREHPQGVFS